MRFLAPTLLLVLTLSACAAQPVAFPQTIQPITACLYKAIKSMPEATGLNGYLQQWQQRKKDGTLVNMSVPMIGFSFKSAGGRNEDELLSLDRPDKLNRASITSELGGDAWFRVINPRLSAACPADYYYADQVIVMRDPPVRINLPVDISRYATSKPSP